MTNYPKPPKSKASVRAAGKNIAASDDCSQSDIVEVDLVDQWRPAHGYVINTFQVFLRNRLRKFDVQASFAQRLKRRKTVIDKLKRLGGPDGKNLISDVTTMHDFAGCRLIFENLKTCFYVVFNQTALFSDVAHMHEKRINNQQKLNLNTI